MIEIFKLGFDENIKQYMLKCVDDMQAPSLDHITKTDWNIPNNVLRTYFDPIKPFINDVYYPFFQKKLGATGIRINNLWFQQYENQATHDWHCHPGTHFSNIYYLEFPKGASKTEFKIDNEIVTFDVKEGDLLTFPGWLSHRSAPIADNLRKTVIVFNSCIEIK